VQVNGREIGDVTPDIGSGGFAAGERMLVVPLARGRNEVRITLTNAIGEKAEAMSLNHEGEGALDKRRTLYILAIGIDKYPGLGNTCGRLGDESCDLSVSGAGADQLRQHLNRPDIVEKAIILASARRSRGRSQLPC
jgi:hypothetical protein